MMREIMDGVFAYNIFVLEVCVLVNMLGNLSSGFKQR